MPVLIVLKINMYHILYNIFLHIQIKYYELVEIYYIIYIVLKDRAFDENAEY